MIEKEWELFRKEQNTFPKENKYCCPICYVWYKTREEKQICLTSQHGFKTLNCSPKKGG